MKPGYINFKKLIRTSDVIVVGQVDHIAEDNFGHVSVEKILKGKSPAEIKVLFDVGESKCFNIKHGKCILCLSRQKKDQIKFDINAMGRGLMPIIRYKNLYFVEIYTNAVVMNVRIVNSKTEIGNERYIPERLGLTKIYEYNELVEIILKNI